MTTQGFFVLHELRLAAGDEATRMLAAAQLADLPRADDEDVLPMLVSIEDHRDVACVRRVRALPRAGDEAGERIQNALTPEPESSSPPRYYAERAALTGERGVRSYYRMAVTESGMNGEAGAIADVSAPAQSMPVPLRPHDRTDADLLWIGIPVASGTGLLVITGHDDASAYADGDPRAWPLPTSRDLGVRIYETAKP